MGPHSWVATSSSSSYSLDENTIRDGEYGMPSYCYCGGRVIRETSRTEQDPGKLYFSCEFRARVSGEIESLQTHHRAGMEELISELKDGELTFIIMDMRIAEKRISDLKEEHEQSKAEITRLELVIGDFNKKYKAVESTFAIAAVLLLLAWFLVWFK
ncbi:unnamed protein product [Microthlaspi erraticum]|uniref:Zinc finger GRF-type domain-containing protein n=1 Tax=Microthlaspi erraticum TaxID=1685480 RepID=A0A6D2KE03_9BRAS|nr:unnamed protein product [Microthlaspi erraticum]CAA7052671.1 unnamed protein product [Microthlaspi erraticum]